MTTILTNPPTTTDSGGNMGIMVVVFLVALLAFLFYVYGVRAMRIADRGPGTIQSATAAQILQVIIPDKIGVDVQPAK